MTSAIENLMDALFETRPFCLSRNGIYNKYSTGGRKTNLLSEKNKLFKFHSDGKIEGKDMAEGLCESHNASSAAMRPENNSDQL